eukprot:TRINITY_DN40410_c0_g1_i1.p1 TRINITY_DN40410_c0_g1~~TRINITY_DN40410_c0_g1_i1.p1  ORF type:complete len:671 (+),score=89.44 TRINITY_DN40410_c0_g1_i1:276-2015(+)
MEEDDRAVVEAALVASDGTLREAELVKSFGVGGYTEGIDALEVPAILGSESADEEPEPRKYRIRARFCQQTAIIETFDLTADVSAANGDLRWIVRRAIAIRGAHSWDVPLVTPAYLLWKAFQTVARARLWTPPELGVGLPTVVAGWAVIDGDALECDDCVIDAVAARSVIFERASWRQRLRPPCIEVDCDPTLSELRISSSSIVSSGSPESVGALFSVGPPSKQLWSLLAVGGIVMAPCSVESWKSFGATVGHVLGRAKFGPKECYWLLQKRHKHLFFETPSFPTFGGFADGVVFVGFKTRGRKGPSARFNGIRLGNALFLVAAGIALALDHGMALQMPLSDSWKKYFLDGGIFSELPVSLWYARASDADFLLGCPPNGGYDRPRLPAGTRNVLMHGYFQHPRYFFHRLPEVRRILSPETLSEKAARLPVRLVSPKHARIAVHVRMGDLFAAGEGWLGISFYRLAVARVAAQLGTSRVGCVLFSDSVDRLRGGFGEQIGCSEHFIVDEPASDDVVLTHMATCCAGIVLSASTFSWWAAILGGYTVVAAPETTRPTCSNKSAPFSLGAIDGWIRLSVPCS